MDVHVYAENQWHMQREAIQLIKDFTTKCAGEEVEFHV